MNILYRLLFILLIMPAFTNAQTISLFENDTTSVPGAHVFCKNLDNQNTFTFFSDKNGKVYLRNIDHFSHLAITIYALGFERLNDTLDDATDNRKYFLKQEQTSLNEMVITAQYAPNNPEKAVHNIRIIDEKKIAAMAAVNLRDVLTNELNIRIGQDNILGSSMKLQGISGQNVKILMDGVPMIGRLNGDIDISQINMNNVERIEIVEGPLSVSYGTDALAGTINIITKKNVGHKIAADVQTYYESVGQYNVNANVGYNFKNQSIRLTGGRNYFDGWNPGDKQFDLNLHPIADSSRAKTWNPKEQYFGSLNYGYKFKALQFYYTLDYFNEVIKNRGYPQYFQTYVNADDDVYKTERLNNAVSVDGKLGNKFRLNGVAGYNYYKRNKNSYVKDLSTLNETLLTDAGEQDTSVDKSIMSRATISHYNAVASVNYEVGYDAKVETASGVRIKGTTQSIGDYALFASMEWKPFKDFIIRPGFRVAYNTDYKAPLIPSLNLRYSIPTIGNGSVNIRGSYARGFRAPNLNELYFDFVDANHTIHGNENLKAEYSNNVDFSINYMRSKGEWSYKTELSSFYTAISNKIDYAIDSSLYDPSKPGAVPMIYMNIEKYRSLGLQFQQSVSYQHLKVTVGASYIGTYNELSEEYAIASISYSPEIKANVFYEWHKPKVTFGFFYKYNGAVPGYDLKTDGTLEQTKYAAYNWADCSVSKLFFQGRLNVGIGSKNIFNVKNVAQSGSGSTSSSPHSSNTGYSPVGMGRSYFMTLAYHFNAD